MKNRFSVSRCCCGLCGEAETYWVDDFTGYPDGQRLTSYGYVEGWGYNAAEVVVGLGSGANAITRNTPYDHNKQTNVSFSIDITGDVGTAQQGIAYVALEPTGGPTLGRPIPGGAGAVFQFYPGSKTRIAATSDNSKDDSSTSWSYGDTATITLNETSVTPATGTQITIVWDVNFYHNGALFFSDTLTRTAEPVDFCGFDCVLYGYNQVLSTFNRIRFDNWNFGMFGLTYPDPYGSPSSGLSWKFDTSTAASLSPTASTGFTPTSYAKASGTFPTGVSINSTTGEISGTPTVALESGACVIEATDSNGVVVLSPEYGWDVDLGI